MLARGSAHLSETDREQRGPTPRPTCPEVERTEVQKTVLFSPLLRIRIRMFLGLPDPDPLVRGADPDPILLFNHKGVERTAIMLAK
jgi:hypothetical protein